MAFLSKESTASLDLNRWAMILVCLSFFDLFGCGSCPAVQEQRTAFAVRDSANKRSGPHMRVEISTETINQRLNRQLGRIAQKDLTISGLGDLSRYAGRYNLRLRRLALQIDKTDAASLQIEVGLNKGDKEIVDFYLKAAAPVELNTQHNRVRIRFRADMFERVEVRLSEQAAERFAAHLRSTIPRSARYLIPRQELSRLAKRSLALLSQRLYRDIRQSLLEPIGQIASVTFTLPDVPIDSIGIVTVDNAIAIEVRTSLNAHGLPPLRKTSIGSNQVRLTMSMDTLVELGNWGMYNGRLPNRYNLKGEATAQGNFSAGLGWQGEQRPLKVNLWSQPSDHPLECLYVRAAAEPRLDLKSGKLKVGFRNGQIEALVGPPLVKEVADVLGISNRVFAYSKGVATKQSLKIGRDDVNVHLESVRLRSSVLSFELGIN